MLIQNSVYAILLYISLKVALLYNKKYIIKEMNAEKRQEKIIKELTQAQAPVSASTLADLCGVSRQVIVGDVALLRAGGTEIESTPRGYVMGQAGQEFAYVGVVACKHNNDKLAEELYTIVDYGGTAIDVLIDHPVYGEISGMLNIASRYDAELFLKQVLVDEVQPLSKLSDGIHIHRIGCRDKEIFNLIVEELKKAGIFYEEAL